MQVTIVNIKVKKDHIHDFINATKINHESSIKESGNRRFDVLQSSDDGSAFVLYESYTNEEEALKHKKTSHYLAWREMVEPWMEEPRKFTVYKGLFPEA